MPSPVDRRLINVMKARAAAPDALVDLNGIPQLKGIELGSDGTLEVGPMTTYTELIASSEARARPILGEVCAQIADVQVRNRGTIGGNICSSDPTNHLPPLMVAIGAHLTVAGPERRADGPGGSVLPRRLHDGGRPRRAADEDHDSARPQRRVSPPIPIGVDGTCIVNAAASANGGVRVALGCVGAVPVLVGPASAEPEAVREAVRSAGLDPPGDVHASAGYRRHLAEVVAARAVEQASKRARE